jgi:hypothetical protein
MRHACRHSYLTLLLVCAVTRPCPGQDTTLVQCSADRVYRDNRVDGGGGQVYCEHVLPGSLVVKDGPFRFWFNRDFEGSTGNYGEGREIGKWKECDRFGRCQQKDYPAIYPDERQRPGFKPEIPVVYVDGKYVFDFSSCRSTWVTHKDASGKPDVELNIGAQANGCSIAYLPEAFMEHGGSGSYNCTIPFQTGKRALESVDLMKEFPKSGLPQYCASFEIKTGPYMSSVSPNRGEGTAQVFTAQYSLGNNGVGIAQARLHFQERAESRSDRCVVRYDPAKQAFYLLSDQSGKYLGPIAAGGPTSLWNSTCFLAGCSSAQVINGELSVQFAIRFNAERFPGEHNMFLEMVDTNQHASPAPVYGQWTVPGGSASVAAEWPSDRSCPVPMLERPLGYFTSIPVNCRDVSGKWADPENGGTWILSQTGDDISGSLTIPRGNCGSVTWQVDGKMSDGIATLNGAQPSPSADKCGVAADKSIAATRAPYCSTTQQGKH